MTPSRSFALDVAAPSLAGDRDAPWTSDADKGLAAAFWLSFHGLSVFAHAVAIFASLAGPVFLALVPIPLLAAMCVDVKPVVKPIERVEMAIIEVPKPEPIVEVVEVLEVVPEAQAKNNRRARPAAVLADEVAVMGMLSILGSSNDTLFAALSASDGTALDTLSRSPGADLGTRIDELEGVEGGVVGGVVSGGRGDIYGGLVGTEGREAYGVGGLGLRGGGEGGGATGWGTIGTGTGTGTGFGLGGGTARKRPRVAIDGASAAQLERLSRKLVPCRVRDGVEGTAVVKGGHVVRATATPKNACVERTLKALALDVDDGVIPFAITPSDL